jgi:hypothetical protein
VPGCCQRAPPRDPFAVGQVGPSLRLAPWDDVAVKKRMSDKKVRKRLQRSLAENVPVVIVRRFDLAEELRGFVLDIGTRWVLLAALRDKAYFYGYTLVRVEDIRRLRLETTFLPVLRTHPAWPPSKPPEPLDLTGPASFLPAIGRLATVFVLHEETRRPEMMWIAAPTEVRKNATWVRMIDPDGTWNDFQTKSKYRHLTRLDFCDDYSHAVLSIAGTHPRVTGSE